MEQFINAGTILDEVQEFLLQPNAYRSLLILFGSLLIAYWLSNLFARGIIKIAQVVSTLGDSESDEVKFLRYRQTETYLSVTVAVVRAAFVSIVAYVVWDKLSPISNSGVAAIGAGTVFIVVAGQTLGMVLRDLTAGTSMIVEKWFNVGDFIKIEPFIDVSGVVERMTLRSTRLRSLSGEIIWVNNQQIQAVHVTPRGVRTMAVDLFARDRSLAEQTISKIIETIPTGPTMLARPLRIKKSERWSDELWRITVVGQTTPGRIWLIEEFFVNALKEVDEGKPKDERIFIHNPIARYADDDADRRFQRAIRVKRETQ